MVGYTVKMVVASEFPDVASAIIEILENSGISVDYLSVEDDDGELSSEYVGTYDYEREVIQ